MKTQIITFKNFDRPLPKDFIIALNHKYPNATTLLVDNETLDFNRWELSLRMDTSVVNFILEYNKLNDNILNEYVKILSVNTDEGYLQFNSETREEVWIVK